MPQNQRTDRKVALGVHLLGDSRPLFTLPDMMLTSDEQWVRHDFTADKRLHFLPDHKLLVTIPEAGDRLVLYRFDVAEALEKSGIDYLFVTSQPPTAAQRPSGAKHTPAWV